MEGGIAHWYAAITRKDLEEFAAAARRVAIGLASDASILEVAPGPGYFAIELAKLGPYRITGLDISESFVRIARANATQAGVAVDFRQGNAAAMPFSNNEFDLAFCRAAFKNFAEPEAALAEMYRVLKPGGRAVIIDMRADASGEAIDAHVDQMKLGWVNRLLTKGILRALRKRAYGEDDFRRFIGVSGFGRYSIVPGGTGFEITLIK
jgi:ubiquinone/menaquinone biosynthesis C-methylase UbiE